MIGRTLSHYKVLEKIGEGGMGEVYRAQDVELGRDVAIKVLREELAADQERLRRFEQEARSASALNHPNIVTIYEIGKHQATPYIAMELVEGETLRKMLTDGPLPTKKLLRISEQIADGLAKAHSAGITHRDLKPENLMVTNDGYVKILDFGLAKLRALPGETDDEAVTVTKEGTVLGTVGYMSPEQAKGLPADHRSDQFSFGAILYEMVTGRRAFQQETSVQTLSAIIERDPESIAALNPETPAHLRLIAERCLAKDREERYDSTRDLARELKLVHAVSDEAAKTPAPQIRADDHLVSVQGKDKVSVSRDGDHLKIQVEDRSSGERIHLEVPARNPLTLLAGILIMVLAVLVGFNVCGARDRLLGKADAVPIRSIAVLPLENLSGDPEQEYFADGMTEAVINELAQIRALKVISRTSVMQYKKVRKSLPEIAEELDVQAVVEGSVIRAGDRVAITAQLIDASSDQHLWSRSYERELKDILTLRKEVARAIAQEIQVELTSPEEARLSQVRTVNADAYDAYLRGRFFFGRMSPENLWKAIQYYNEAIAIDPGFAPAYAGLAEVYGRQLSLMVLPPQEAYSKCKATAEKALEMDDTLAEAHVALAWAKWVGEWDWSGGEEAFQRAIELNDGYALAHLWYGWFLVMMGRTEEGIFELQRALELDPVSRSANIILAYGYYLARHYDPMLEHCKRTVELDPTFAMGHGCLAQAYRQKSMHKEAIAAVQEAIRIGGRQTNLLFILGFSYAAAGEKTEALKIIDEVKQIRNQTYIDPGFIGFIYADLGDVDEAMQWLEKAYEEHAYSLLWVKAPFFDGLRSDPRLKDILRRMDFPE